MRNYRGITEFLRKASLDRLRHFDDEYFVVLKRNAPYLAAFPSCAGNAWSPNPDFRANA